VFAADLLPTDLIFPCGFIANTDNHLHKGRHWTAFFFPNSTTIEYFDSYGKPIDYFNTEFSKYTSHFSNLVVNYKQLQSVYSDVCGMYCLFFLFQRMNGVSFHDIIERFSNVYDYNDSFVYNFVNGMFPYCQHVCVYNQICRPLLK
jgi:hypothetical protein